MGSCGVSRVPTQRMVVVFSIHRVRLNLMVEGGKEREMMPGIRAVDF